MSYKEAMKDILSQFDSYKSNCAHCYKKYPCGDWNEDMSEICDYNETICRNKLLEAAMELDNK